MYIRLENTSCCNFLFVKHHIENCIMEYISLCHFFDTRHVVLGSCFKSWWKSSWLQQGQSWSSHTEVSCHPGPVPLSADPCQDAWRQMSTWFLLVFQYSGLYAKQNLISVVFLQFVLTGLGHVNTSFVVSILFGIFWNWESFGIFWNFFNLSEALYIHEHFCFHHG